ncbi:hypothetical protein EV182_004696, partial [Spiromyces aspiralis]
QSHTNYSFLSECIYTLISICATQVREERIVWPSNPNFFLRQLAENIGGSTSFHADHPPAQEVVEKLLALAVEPPEMPPAGGLVYSAYTYLFSQGRKGWHSTCALESAAMLLLLLLVCQPGPRDAPHDNIFRACLSRVENTLPGKTDRSQISFQQLFDKLLGSLEAEEHTLLLHILVALNPLFSEYLVARTDPDAMLMPVLKAINSTLAAIQTTTPATTMTTGAAATAAAAVAATTGHQSGNASSHSPAASRKLSGQFTPNLSIVDTPIPPLPSSQRSRDSQFLLLYSWCTVIFYLTQDRTFIQEIRGLEVASPPWLQPRQQRDQPLLLFIISELAITLQKNLLHIK